MKQFTSVIIFNPEKAHILLLKRAETKKTHPGYITGFGGTVEEGETPLGCMVRELMEETGLTVSDLREVSVCHFDDNDGYGHRDIFIYTGFSNIFDITVDPEDGSSIILEFRKEAIELLRNNFTEACWFTLLHLLEKTSGIKTITSEMRDQEIAWKERQSL